MFIKIILVAIVAVLFLWIVVDIVKGSMAKHNEENPVPSKSTGKNPTDDNDTSPPKER